MTGSSPAAFTTLVLALLAASLATDASARGRVRARVHSRAEVEATIRRAENASDVFRKQMDDKLDKSALDGTKTEDNVNHQAKELENALDRLRRRFDKTDTWRETRREVQDVLLEARDVNRIMEAGRWRAVLEAEWTRLRRELNSLAGHYDLPPLGH